MFSWAKIEHGFPLLRLLNRECDLMTHLMIIGHWPATPETDALLRSEVSGLISDGYAIDVVTDCIPQTAQENFPPEFSPQLHTIPRGSGNPSWHRVLWWVRVTAAVARRSRNRGSVWGIALSDIPPPTRRALTTLGIKFFEAAFEEVSSGEQGLSRNVSLIEQQIRDDENTATRSNQLQEVPPPNPYFCAVNRVYRQGAVTVLTSSLTRTVVRLWDQVRSGLIEATTLSAKIRKKMLIDDRAYVRSTTDKILVRDYVKEVAGEQYLTPLIAHFSRIDDYTPHSYGTKFVMKPTHGSGVTIIVDSTASASLLTFPLSTKRWQTGILSCAPNQLSSPEIRALLMNWLTNDYGQSRWRHDPSYRRLQRAIIVEPLLNDSTGDLPVDYKFFVMNGRVAWLQVHANRLRGRTVTFHWPTWDRIPVHHGVTQPLRAMDKPKRFPEMIALAEKLGADTDMVRVDLYHTDEGVRFGEMTHFPNAGKFRLYPREYKKVLAARWTLPRQYID